MPVYNTASTVIAAIKSVLAQTDPNFELLVMIDGSPDHSAQLIADYLQQNPDERVRVFNNPKNQGLSAMRNQGLDEARGDWVTFPDSDDALYPIFLERLHHHAERTGGAGGQLRPQHGGDRRFDYAAPEGCPRHADRSGGGVRPA